MAKLILVRGLPGSGKSTYARSLGCLHLEADMYFMRDGSYKFNPQALQSAHKWCSDTCEYHLSRGLDVVVSNTFTKLWEMNAYIHMVMDTPSIFLTVVKCVGDYGSVHDVPADAIERMRNRWEDYPGEVIFPLDKSVK